MASLFLAKSAGIPGSGTFLTLGIRALRALPITVAGPWPIFAAFRLSRASQIVEREFMRTIGNCQSAQGFAALDFLGMLALCSRVGSWRSALRSAPAGMRS